MSLVIVRAAGVATSIESRAAAASRMATAMDAADS